MMMPLSPPSLSRVLSLAFARRGRDMLRREASIDHHPPDGASGDWSSMTMFRQAQLGRGDSQTSTMDEQT